MYIFGNAGPRVCPERSVYSGGPAGREEGGAAVMNPKGVPGYCFVGTVETPLGTFPLYRTEKPKGRPSINTLEGWNLHRRDMARFALLEALQREPTEEETQAEMARSVREAQRILAELRALHGPEKEVPIVFTKEARR